MSDAHLQATEARAPKPRDVLCKALAALADARAGLSKLEVALPVARAAVSEAQSRHDRAAEAAEGANANAAENLAASFFEGTRPTDPARVAAAARAELAAAVDALVIAKNARVILDGKITDARAAVGYASDRAKKAARGVIGAEQLEDRLGEATDARATYLESVGQRLAAAEPRDPGRRRPCASAPCGCRHRSIGMGRDESRWHPGDGTGHGRVDGRSRCGDPMTQEDRRNLFHPPNR